MSLCDGYAAAVHHAPKRPPTICGLHCCTCCQQVSTTVADKNRQLDNLRQQSTYYLQKKSDEIATLREQLSKLRISSQEEVGGLMVRAG